MMISAMICCSKLDRCNHHLMIVLPTLFQNNRSINTSAKNGRNFFDYKQFTGVGDSGSPPRSPPKPPENFATAYKRRPLYWMIRGTDVMKEHNRLCIAVAGISFVIMSAMVALIYYRHQQNPEHFKRKLLFKMQRDDGTAESQGMFNLKKRLMDMDLLSNFLNVNVDDYGEMELLPPQVDINYDDILHGGKVLQRQDIGRDFTKLNANENSSSSLKEVDKIIRSS